MSGGWLAGGFNCHSASPERAALDGAHFVRGSGSRVTGSASRGHADAPQHLQPRFAADTVCWAWVQPERCHVRLPRPRRWMRAGRLDLVAPRARARSPPRRRSRVADQPLRRRRCGAKAFKRRVWAEPLLPPASR